MLAHVLQPSLQFLLQTQQPNGSFVSLSSTNPRFLRPQTYTTTFLTSLILSCLNTLPALPEVEVLQHKAAEFLLTEKSAQWSFNYWSRQSSEYRQKPYPDDFDDTACALAALTQYNPSLITGEVLAHIVKLLMLVEIKPGGPYATWLLSPESAAPWRDCDLAVNSNVGYFLALHKIQVPGITHMIDEALVSETFTSPYYPSSYPVIYFISRFYTGSQAQRLRDYILKLQDKHGTWGDPLSTALAISSLLRLGEAPTTLQRGIDYILQSQRGGQWKAYPFCYDPAQHGKPAYAGSSALTTAFCLACLYAYEQTPLLGETATNVEPKTDPSPLITNIKKTIHATVADFPSDLHRLTHDYIVTFLTQDRDYHTLLVPWQTAQALGSTMPATDPLLEKLGCAMFFGWVAYTIYDDFFDNEGHLPLLPVANVAHQTMITTFLDAMRDYPEFIALCQSILRRQEAANAWELTHTRFSPSKELPIPNYGDYRILAERSLGHSLGALAIVQRAGYGANTPEHRQLQTFFEHYLIARQLNDDAHDWKKDMAAGSVNAVGALLLTQMHPKHTKRSSTVRLKVLEQLFWEELLPSVTQLIMHHCHQAREALRENKAIKQPNIFLDWITPVEQASQEAFEQQTETLKFIRTYRKRS